MYSKLATGTVIFLLHAVVITSNETYFFQGFLIQAVTVAGASDGASVGMFVGLPAQIGDTDVMARIGDCSSANSSATHMHPSNDDTQNFPYVTLDWMSPPEGTGAIRFRYVCYNRLDQYRKYMLLMSNRPRYLRTFMNNFLSCRL